MRKAAERLIFGATMLAIVALFAVPGVRLEAQKPAPPPTLPPLVQTCPMHPDIVETKPGTCPLCKMNLVAARLDAAWMCPLHAAVIENAPGSCRLCAPHAGAGHRVAGVDVPGRGQRAAPRAGPLRRRLAAHHQADAAPPRQPQPAARRPVLHGARQLAPPRGHLSARRQLPPVRLRRLRPGAERRRRWARSAHALVAEERYDPATKKTTELRVFPLRVSKDGAYLEADPGHRAWPSRLTAKVTLKKGEAEHRFDFTFAAATVDPTAPGAAHRPRRTRHHGRRVPRARGAGSRRPPAPAVVETPAAPAIVELPPAAPAPTTIPEIVEAIRAKHAGDRRPGGKGRLRRHLGARVPGQGSGARARAAPVAPAGGRARGRPSRRSSAWCRAPGASTRWATPATARRWSWPSGCSARRWPTSPPRSARSNTHAGTTLAGPRRRSRCCRGVAGRATPWPTSRSRRRSPSTRTCCRSRPRSAGRVTRRTASRPCRFSATKARCRGASRCGSSWWRATCRRGRAASPANRFRDTRRLSAPAS